MYAAAPVRIVCVSDTHLRGLSVPDGDVLLHAGDLTMGGQPREVAEAADFLRALPHRHKVVIAGNHDFLFQDEPAAARRLMDGLVYLEDSEATVAGLRIWGSPWQPWFYDWAFNLRRGAPIRAKWDLVPAGIDVLLTHGPPAGHGDRTARGEAVGCADLRAAVRRVRPRWHVFGHIHEGHGTTEEDGTTFVNASVCDVRYRPVNPPIVLEA
jgi:calcineurin-like phosphoesterase family protein